MVNNQDLKERQKEFDEKIIEKPFLEKMKRDKEKEYADKEAKRQLENQNIRYLRNQIHDNKQRQLNVWKHDKEHEKRVVSKQIGKFQILSIYFRIMFESLW